jgi:hypothetical protein
MATKASRIALAGSNISSTGEVDADLLDNIDSAAFLSLDGNGRLGIGTASPSTKLTVKNNNSSTSFGDNNLITLQNLNTTDNSRMGLAFTGNTNIGSGLAIIEAVSYDQSQGHTSLNFSVYSGSWHNDMMVLKAGNVGINSTNPSAKLTVEGTFQVRTSSNQSFNDSNNANNLTMTDSKSHFNIDGADKDFQISSDTVTHALFVQGSDGRVGIGTSSPESTFHVNRSSFSSTERTMKINNGGNNGGAQYDTLVINQPDVPSVRLVETLSNQELTLSVGNENSNAAVIGSTGKLIFAIGRSASTIAYSDGGRAMTIDSTGKVGIGTSSPATSLHVKPPSGPDGFAAGGKTLSMTTSFQTGAQLEITLGDHRACYVKVFITGDWSGHSAVAFLGEYFIQNGANGYAEAGMIIREVDNTAGPAGDHVSSQIYDGGNVDSFQIQFKLNAFSGGVTTLNGVLTYQVMGQFNAIT